MILWRLKIFSISAIQIVSFWKQSFIQNNKSEALLAFSLNLIMLAGTFFEILQLLFFFRLFVASYKSLNFASYKN